MTVRRLVVVAVALLLAAEVIRNAAVVALAPLQPATAAKLWEAHPSVEIALALAQIGTASRQRSPIAPHTFAMIDEAAAKSPLSAEPYLVRGVRAQIAGDAGLARAAFAAAQQRDPRSLPAAYFLADYYFRAGNALAGLQQTALLARLSPNGAAAVAPFVAAYAQNRTSWPQMRALFRSEPGLEGAVLAALAQDARNADAVLALADRAHRTPDSAWLPIMIEKLIANGDYARARAIWSSIGGAGANGQLVFDGNFSSPKPPPPFNWSLATSGVGLAERQPGNRLHVIFYGNQDGVLASELVLLPPGRYRLQMQLEGAPLHPESLQWSIRCDRSEEPIASADIDQSVNHGVTFEISANCPAQWLELSGRSGDVAEQAEATLKRLSLTRVGPNA